MHPIDEHALQLVRHEKAKLEQTATSSSAPPAEEAQDAATKGTSVECLGQHEENENNESNRYSELQESAEDDRLPPRPGAPEPSLHVEHSLAQPRSEDDKQRASGKHGSARDEAHMTYDASMPASSAVRVELGECEKSEGSAKTDEARVQHLKVFTPRLDRMRWQQIDSEAALRSTSNDEALRRAHAIKEQAEAERDALSARKEREIERLKNQLYTQSIQECLDDDKSHDRHSISNGEVHQTEQHEPSSHYHHYQQRQQQEEEAEKQEDNLNEQEIDLKTLYHAVESVKRIAEELREVGAAQLEEKRDRQSRGWEEEKVRSKPASNNAGNVSVGCQTDVLLEAEDATEGRHCQELEENKVVTGTKAAEVKYGEQSATSENNFVNDDGELSLAYRVAQIEKCLEARQSGVEDTSEQVKLSNTSGADDVTLASNADANRRNERSLEKRKQKFKQKLRHARASLTGEEREQAMRQLRLEKEQLQKETQSDHMRKAGSSTADVDNERAMGKLPATQDALAKHSGWLEGLKAQLWQAAAFTPGAGSRAV